MTAPFTLSIETTAGQSYQHGFHLGTDERLARQIAEERFHARIKHGYPTVTVALMREGKMVDCYGGRWFGQQSLDDTTLPNGAKTTSEREYILHAIACAERNGQTALAQDYRDTLADFEADEARANDGSRACKQWGTSGKLLPPVTGEAVR